MLDDFPPIHCKDRENLILDIVQNQQDRLSFSWYPLKVAQDGHLGIFYVLSDALKIDGVRVNLTAETEQKIADLWGCMLLTAKLCDLIWHNAEIRVEPYTMSITSSTRAMIEHSQNIDKQLPEGYEGKLISTVGKDWIIDSKMSKPKVANQAVNYGWHFVGNSFKGISGNINSSLLKDPKTGQYWKVIQPPSLYHNYAHSDYSQVCRLVTRECNIDGVTMDLADVLKDPKLSKLISHSGPQQILRQPGVPSPEILFITPQQG